MAIKQRVIWRALSPVMQINLRRINLNIRKSLYLKSKSYKSLKEERQTDRQTDRQMLICKRYFLSPYVLIFLNESYFYLFYKTFLLQNTTECQVGKGQTCTSGYQKIVDCLYKIETP